MQTYEYGPGANLPFITSRPDIKKSTIYLSIVQKKTFSATHAVVAVIIIKCGCCSFAEFLELSGNDEKLAFHKFSSTWIIYEALHTLMRARRRSKSSRSQQRPAASSGRVTKYPSKINKLEKLFSIFGLQTFKHFGGLRCIKFSEGANSYGPHVDPASCVRTS